MSCTIHYTLAPNGKKSKLFDSMNQEFGPDTAFRSWIAIQTPILQQEFENSQIRDLNGELVPMYKVSQATVPGVINQKFQTGVHYSANSAKSDEKIPVFINSANVETYSSYPVFLQKVAEEFGITSKPTKQQIQQYVQTRHNNGIDVALDGFTDLTVSKTTTMRTAIDTKSEDDIFFPIRSQEKDRRNAELEGKLVEFLSQYGISVAEIESLKTSYGVEALGVADIANKLILLSKNKATENTLPEEAGHFILELLGENNPLRQRMLQLAEQTPEFEKVKEKYDGKYEGNKEKLLLETAGKILATEIQSKFQELKDSPLKRIIKRIWERVQQIFKNADTVQIENDIRDTFGSLAVDILNNATTDLSASNLTSTDVFFELDEEEETDTAEPQDAESEKVKVQLTKAQSLIAQAKNAIELQISLIEKTTAETDEDAKVYIKNLRHQQETLSQENNKAAIVEFLIKAQDDLRNIRKRLLRLESEGRVNAKDLLQYHRYVQAYNDDFIQELLDEVEDSEEFKKTLTGDITMEQISANFSVLNKQIRRKYFELARPLLAKALNKLNTNQELSEDQINALLKEGASDIMSITRWVDAIATSPDAIVALAGKMLNQQIEKTRLETLDVKNEFTDKINEFEKFRKGQGINIANSLELYGIFYKKDTNGKPTGRLLSIKEAEAAFGKDSKEMEYYTYFKKFYDTYQQMLPHKYNKGLWLPSIRKTVTEYMSEGMSYAKAAQMWAKDLLTVQLDDTGFGNQESTLKYVPVHYHSKIGDGENSIPPAELSYDLGQSLLSFATMALNNRNMNEIVSELEVLKDILGDRDVLKTSNKQIIKDRLKKFGGDSEQATRISGVDSNIYKQFEMALDMILYGEVKDRSTITIAGKTFSKVKLADTLNKYSSLRSLALNLYSGFSNLTMGKTMNFLEAYAGEWFSVKDYARATAEYVTALGRLDFIRDSQQKTPSSFIGQLVDKFDALNEFDQYGNEIKDNTAWKRLMGSNAAFMFQRGGEHEIQTTLLLAYLKGNKIKNKAGEEISLYDAFEQIDGKLVVKDSVDYTMEQIIRDTQRIKQISQKLHGLYNNQDLINMQKVWAGRMGLLFRKWLVPGFKKRWGNAQYNQRLEEWEGGTYRTASKFLFDVFKGVQQDKLSIVQAWKQQKSELKPWEIKNMRRAKIGAITSLAVTAVIALIAGLDDEDEERGWFANMTLYQLYRLKGELTMYLNPNEARKILQSPAASISTLEAVIKLTTDTFELGGSLLLYGEAPRYERDSGLYKEGDLKILKSMEQLIPYLKEIRAITVPGDRLKMFL